MATSVKRRKSSLTDVSEHRNEVPVHTKLALQVTYICNIQVKLEKELSSLVGSAYHTGSKSDLTKFDQLLSECAKFKQNLENLGNIKIDVKNLSSEHKNLVQENACVAMKLDAITQENKTLKLQLAAIIGSDESSRKYTVILKSIYL